MGSTATAEAATEPSLPIRLVTAVIEHSETWGKVWFGLIFWGSVLFAVARRVWPDTATLPLLAGSLAVGLAAGTAAHIRGYWL